MNEITITVSDPVAAKLREYAKYAGLTLEEFMQKCVERMIDAREEEFARAAAYVLEKRAEVYRRLAE